MTRTRFVLLAMVLFTALLAGPSQHLLAAGATLSGRVSDPSSVGVSGATVGVYQPGTATLVASTATDTAGNYSVPVEEGTYDIKVTPSAGSTFQEFLAPNRLVGGTTTLNFTLVSASSVTLSGFVRDGLGVPVPGQAVTLVPSIGGSNFNTVSDPTGHYQLSVAPGQYQISVSANTSVPTLAIPPVYSITTTSALSITANTSLDLDIPVQPLTVRVQDPARNGVAGVRVGTNVVGQSGILFAGVVGSGASYVLGTGLATDANGDVTLWLYPTLGSGRYTLTATPPAGSPFAAFSASGVALAATGSTQVFVLLFVHAPPVTTASFSPPAIGGIHPGPVEVTLSATAASGFSVASTTYRVDGGPTLPYTGTFTISGDGDHTLTVQSTDNIGVFETPRTFNFKIESLRIVTLPVLVPTTVGSVYFVELAASGGTGTCTWTIVPMLGDLPEGLSLAPDSGVISGTPVGVEDWTFTIECTAGGQTTSRQFTLSVVNPAPEVSGIAPTGIPAGVPDFDITVTGEGFVPGSVVQWNGVPLITAFLSSTELSAHVTTSDVAAPGFADLTVVTPGPGGGTSLATSFNVGSANHAPTANAGGPYGGVIGTSINLTALATDLDGDAISYYWDLDGNGEFEAPGQVVEFVATGLDPRTVTVTLIACDIYSVCGTSTAVVNVLSPITITTPSPLDEGVVGTPYNVTFEATGGTEPYHWSVVGLLPPGLSLDGDSGVLSGIPTVAGTYGFTVVVTDSSSVTQSKSYTLTPPPPPGVGGQPYPPTPLPPIPPPPGDGEPVPACSNYALAPESDPLPPGMTLDPVTGVLSGTPTSGGTYRIIVQCTYSTSQTASAEFVITINNPVPALEALSPNAATEGDPGFTLVVSGTGFVLDSVVLWNAVPLETTYVSSTELHAIVLAAGVAAPAVASITALNPGPGGGESNALPFTVEPANVAPEADAGGPYTGTEGAIVLLFGNATDLDGDALSVAWTFSAGADVDGGTTCTFDDSSSLTSGFSCTDDGTFTLTPSVSDGKAGTVTSTTNVSLANQAPVPALTGPVPGSLYSVGTSVSFSGSFTDAGQNDTHSCAWNLDGPSTTGTVIESSGAGSCTATHAFDTPGVYQLVLTITDDDAGTGQADTIGEITALIVVYDPDGGFVTGGGWINSPAGAYTPDPTLYGRASFGFNAKYKKGATDPTGQTEFQFRAGDLNFHSDVYEWLVVAGARAQFKGSGTINGQNGFDFKLTIIDGQSPGGGGVDRFRMKIWDRNTGGVIYDNSIGAGDDGNPATPLGGGNVVIHKN